MARLKQPGCCECSDPIGCNAIQFFTNATAHGVDVPAIDGGYTGLYVRSGDAETDLAAHLYLDPFKNAFGLMYGQGIATSYGGGLAGSSGRRVAEIVTMDAAARDGIGDPFTLHLRAAFDVVTGYLIHVSGYWTTLSAGAGSYDWSVNMTTGEVVELGTAGLLQSFASMAESRAFGEPAIGGSIQYTLSFDQQKFSVTKIESPGDPEEVITMECGPFTETWAEARIDEVIPLDMTDRSAEVQAEDGSYVGAGFEWNRCYELIDSINFAKQLGGWGGITDPTVELAEEPNYSVFPQRIVAVLRPGGFTLNPNLSEWNISHTLTFPTFYPNRYGKNYFGRWVWAGESYGAACYIEIAGIGNALMNRLFAREQSAPGFSFFDLDHYDFSGDFHLLAGRHYLRPADLIFDYGCAVLQRRVYWDDYLDFVETPTCYTFEPQNPEEHLQDGPGWEFDQNPRLFN